MMAPLVLRNSLRTVSIAYWRAPFAGNTVEQPYARTHDHSGTGSPGDTLPPRPGGGPHACGSSRVQEIAVQVGGEFLVWQGTAYIRQGHQLHRVTGRTAAEIVHDQRVCSGIERAFLPAGEETT